VTLLDRTIFACAASAAARNEFETARPLDPLREVARYAAAGIDDQEHDPPYLHGLPFGHRLVGYCTETAKCLAGSYAA
jgi:hypothetical protein